MNRMTAVCIACACLMVGALFAQEESEEKPSGECGSILIVSSDTVRFQVNAIELQGGMKSAYVIVPYTKWWGGQYKPFIKAYDCVKGRQWDLGPWLSTPQVGIVYNTHTNAGSMPKQAVTWYAYGMQENGGYRRAVLIIDGVVIPPLGDGSYIGDISRKFGTSVSGKSWWLCYGTGNTGYLIINGRPYEGVLFGQGRVIHRYGLEDGSEYLCFLQVATRGDGSQVVSMRQVAID